MASSPGHLIIANPPAGVGPPPPHTHTHTPLAQSLATLVCWAKLVGLAAGLALPLGPAGLALAGLALSSAMSAYPLLVAVR